MKKNSEWRAIPDLIPLKSNYGIRINNRTDWKAQKWIPVSFLEETHLVTGNIHRREASIWQSEYCDPLWREQLIDKNDTLIADYAYGKKEHVMQPTFHYEDAEETELAVYYLKKRSLWCTALKKRKIQRRYKNPPIFGMSCPPRIVDHESWTPGQHCYGECLPEQNQR